MSSFFLYFNIVVYWTNWPMCFYLPVPYFVLSTSHIVLTLFISTLFLFWNSYDSGSTSCKEKISAYKIPLCVADCLWSSSIYVQRGEKNSFNLVPRPLVDEAKGKIWPNPICTTWPPVRNVTGEASAHAQHKFGAVKTDLHGTTLSHTTSLRQAYDMT